MAKSLNLSLFEIYKDQIIKSIKIKKVIWINVDTRYFNSLQTAIIENICENRALILNRFFFYQHIFPHFYDKTKYVSTLKKLVESFHNKMVFIQIEFLFFRSLIDLMDIVSQDKSNKTYTIFIIADNKPFIFIHYLEMIQIIDICNIPYCVLNAENSSIHDYINYGHIYFHLQNSDEKRLLSFKEFENRLFSSLGYLGALSSKRDLSFFITVYSFMCYCCMHKLNPTWKQFLSFITEGHSWDVKTSFFNKWIDAMDIMLFPIPEFYVLPPMTQIALNEPSTKRLVFVRDITALSYMEEHNLEKKWPMFREYNILHHHLKSFRNQFHLGYWELFKNQYLSICYQSYNQIIIHHIIVIDHKEANKLKQLIEESSGIDLLGKFKQKYKILILDNNAPPLYLC